MATVSAVILKHQKKQDGTWNAKIRISHKGRSVYLDTPIFASKSDLDTKLRLKKVFIDSHLISIVQGYRDKINQLGLKSDFMSVTDLKEHLSAREVIDFFEYAYENVDKMIEGKQKSTGMKRKVSVNVFRKYIKQKSFSMDMLTSKVLRLYEAYLFDLKYSPFTVRNYISDLRAIFNEAKFHYNDEEIGIVRIHNSPFSRYKEKPLPESRKKGLEISIDKMKFIRDVQIEKPEDEFTRDLFMLSFYMLGTNANDFYTYLTDPNIERFEYTRNKTKGRRKDHALISVKVVDEAKPLIKKIAGVMQEKYASAKSVNNRLYTSFKTNLSTLFGVENCTYYHARHAFATIAANAGYEDSEIERALNHKTHSIVNVYANRDWSLLDRMQRDVLDLLK